MNRREFLKVSASAAGLTVVPFFADLFGERYLVEVNRYRIPVPNLPPQFNGFTIVHLTDLHYGMVSKSFVRKVVNKANSIKGDVIVCTGDFVHHRNTDREINGVWPILSELQAPLGVYSVLGNHDHWAGADRSFYWLERTGQNLRHEARSFKREGKRLWIAGGGDLWEDHRSFDHILRNVPRKDCRIVLAHNPDSADTAFSDRVDLIISRSYSWRTGVYSLLWNSTFSAGAEHELQLRAENKQKGGFPLYLQGSRLGSFSGKVQLPPGNSGAGTG